MKRFYNDQANLNCHRRETQTLVSIPDLLRVAEDHRRLLLFIRQLLPIELIASSLSIVVPDLLVVSKLHGRFFHVLPRRVSRSQPRLAGPSTPRTFGSSFQS